MQNNLLTIREFAKLCRTTVRTIHFYEEKGLLAPVTRDHWNKYRFYEDSQGRLFFKIKLLQSFHVPLNEIREIIKTETPEEFLDNKVKSLHAEIKAKEKEYLFLKKFKQFYFEVNNLSKVLKQETFGPYILFGKHIEKEDYHRISPDAIEVTTLAKDLKIPRSSKSLVIYYDAEKYKPLGSKIEISLITKLKKLPKNMLLPKGYFFREFPKTAAYAYTYKGPYEFITLVYEKLHQLEITKNFPVVFQPFDLQYDDFLDPKLKYDLTTKICFPLRLASLAQGRPVK